MKLKDTIGRFLIIYSFPLTNKGYNHIHHLMFIKDVRKVREAVVFTCFMSRGSNLREIKDTEYSFEYSWVQKRGKIVEHDAQYRRRFIEIAFGGL